LLLGALSGQRATNAIQDMAHPLTVVRYHCQPVGKYPLGRCVFTTLPMTHEPVVCVVPSPSSCHLVATGHPAIAWVLAKTAQDKVKSLNALHAPLAQIPTPSPNRTVLPETTTSLIRPLLLALCDYLLLAACHLFSMYLLGNKERKLNKQVLVD